MAEIVLYALAMLLFVVVMFLILEVFEKEAEYFLLLKDAEKGASDVTRMETQLTKYDHWIKILFVVGVAISIIIGILSAVNQLDQKGGEAVKNIKVVVPLPPSTIDSSVDMNKSASGFSNFKPDSAKPATQSASTSTSNTGGNKDSK